MIQILYLNDLEIKRLKALLHENVLHLAAKSKAGFHLALRDEFLFLTALYTGLKTSELIKLKEKHTDLSHQTLRVVDSSNPRDIPLSFDFSKELSIYIRRLDLSPEDYLFSSNKEEGMTQRAVQFRFLSYMKTLGFKHSISALRHTFAIKMIKASNDPLWVAELLGLKTRTQISIYLHHMDKISQREQRQIIYELWS